MHPLQRHATGNATVSKWRLPAGSTTFWPAFNITSFPIKTHPQPPSFSPSWLKHPTTVYRTATPCSNALGVSTAHEL